jgi:FkbM family methyltransferase
MFGRLKRHLSAAPPPPPNMGQALPPLPAPPALSLEERVDMATRCRDCDILPKVPQAGELVTSPDGTRIQIAHNGLRVVADGYCGPWMTDLIRRCHGHHEPQEERVFHEIVARMPQAATMIELGAWWSFYSLWFLKDAPARRAVALEPDPARRAVGEANAALNHLAPVFADGFAGGTAAEAAPFTLDDGRRLDIPRVTVPQLMDTHGIATLDLLHCDAQGAEFDVLTGCLPLLRQARILTVVVSTHHHAISGDPLTHQRCLALIEEAGGFVLAEHDVQESFSGDGLIAARFGPDQAGWPVIPLSLNRYSTSLFRNPLHDLAEAWRG